MNDAALSKKLSRISKAFPAATPEPLDAAQLAAQLAAIPDESPLWSVVGSAWARHMGRRQKPHAGPGRPRIHPEGRPRSKRVKV